MPALFKAEDILKDESKEKTIDLDCYVIPDGFDMPNITVEITDKSRQAFRKAVKKHITPVAIQRSRGMEWKPKDETVEFVMLILKAAYKASENWIDKPTLQVIEAQLKKQIKVAKFIAEKLSEVFETDETIKKAEEDDDEKN